MSHDLPSLNALRAFEATARHNSVSKAAEQLHVTHGAVSRQLKALEHELGVSLFTKDGRGLKLTEAGSRLRDGCVDAFGRLRAVCRELEQVQAQAPFLLGCSGSLLARWFIPRLGKLNADLPDLRLHLSAGEGDVDPHRAGWDALLVFAEPPWPADMHVHDLGPERIGPVISPHHQQFARLATAPASALLGEPLLHTYSRPQAWPEWARQQGLAPAQLKLGQGFEHLYYLLEAAVAGLGVAIAPQVLVAEDILAGRLAAPWGFTETPARLALWVAQRRQDLRALRLADWLREALQGA
ncbi:LysR family transcriptional regulator [Pseudomonas typographi]|uniref:LysR family transcriptional regulator n=1 Tax=Pseudomonas typographi TaxID=2715964 RepID=UPI0016832279|nr:LysR family transcriptional regulator [Pseudomonas typographi]MBD1588291.1 LysR family transcriptional regulator [Pseudomonas typographi]